MQTLSMKNDSSWLSKVFRIAIPAALIYGGIKLFNAFAPTLIAFFQNIWYCVLLGLPLAFIFIYVISNPKLIWMSYKTLCDKMTGFIIRMDPLSFMQRYIDILQEKLKNLRKSKVFLEGKKIELSRECDTLLKNININLKTAKASKGINDELMQHHAYLAESDKETLDTYKPLLQRMENNLTFLEKLDQNWSLSIEKLQHDVNKKKKEYIMLRESAKALGYAEEFAKGNTEESKIYEQSVLALEQKVTQKIAFIEDFEKKSKMTMDKIDIEKNLMNQDGMTLLDEYMNNEQLLLPEGNWSDALVIGETATPIKKNNTNTESKSGLLHID
jgi:hypothetical protein